MKYYIISGEPSGDLHASNIVNHLKGIKLDEQLLSIQNLKVVLFIKVYPKLIGMNSTLVLVMMKV